MSEHFFSCIDSNELFAIVNSKGKSHHIWYDLACSIPDLDNFFFSFFVHILDLFEQFKIDVKSFIERPCHEGKW